MELLTSTHEFFHQVLRSALTSHALTQPETLILCTDGLTKMVNESDIAYVLRCAPTPQQAADVLVELANDWGGVDNTTVIVVRIEPVSKAQDR